MKTVAVGDIHGCYNELLTLVDHIRKQTAGEDLKWVFVGDYIDRGPASREVIEYLKTSFDNETNVFLRGNHEDMALGLGPNYRNSRELAYYNWMLNGGDLTLASYPGKRMSREHLDWLYRTKLFHKDYLRTYVHAGFYRHLPIEQQDPHVLTWIREEFLRDSSMQGGYVVHGHTPGYNIELMPNRCNLDTGCVYGHRYSAIGGVLSAGIFDTDRPEPLFTINNLGNMEYDRRSK